MPPDRDALLAKLLDALAPLSTPRLGVLTRIVEAFASELVITQHPTSDFADGAFAQLLGDTLLIHHTLSNENFTKDKFEHGIVAALRGVGKRAELTPRGTHGADLLVDDERWSLKTQADRSIKPNAIHISKFMELGKGRWRNAADLEALRDRMFDHMKGYDRIFTLRALSAATRYAQPFHEYELVEIPKSLLKRAANAPCVMKEDSRQNPKPGSCVVTRQGKELFELYFDGGTERKLQIRNLAKVECQVHATWRFPHGALPA